MTSRKMLSLSPIALCLVAVVSFALPAFTGSAPDDRAAAASCQRCGDGYCAPSCENERTCPADCKSTRVAAPVPEPPAAAPGSKVRCGRCGDGQCVKSCGETSTTCPIDCGGGGEPSSASASTAEAAECDPAKSEDTPRDK